MDERVLWGLSAVLLMALLMEADPERLWALTKALVRGALEGLLKGVLLGFWLFKRWEWRLLLPLAMLLFAAVPLPLAVRPPARPGVEALACLLLGLLFYGRQLWWLVPQLDEFPPPPILLRATQNWLGADLYGSFLSFYLIAPGLRRLWRWGRSER